MSKKIHVIRAAAMLMSFWVSMMSAGCSGGSRYALLSAAGLEGWEHVTSPRGPQGVEEETVCQAANSREVVINGDTTAILLSAAPSRQIVVAIAGPANHDEMTPKRITYYLVVNGKIAAHSNPVLEPSPDIDYEKTVFKAAVTSTVIIYSRPARNLTVKGSYKNECIADVRVLNGFDTTGEVLSDRMVNICFDN